jgi:hypothetical protein
VGSTPTLFRHPVKDAMMATAPFLHELKTAAEAAKTAEGHFRRDAAVRIATLEQERAFAFRRFNLMQTIVEAIASAESEEVAMAGAFAVLSMRLGWTSDSEAHTEVTAHFAPVALAVFRASTSREDGPATNLHDALADFENWYAETRGSPFWTLFEHQMPDTPVVDF